MKVYLLDTAGKQGINPDPHYIPLGNVKVFFINNFELSSLRLEHVYLYFYDSALYKISCNYDKDLIDRLTTKYGTPVAKDKDEHYKIWKNGNSKIAAEAFLGISCSECPESYLNYFMIVDTSIQDEIYKTLITKPATAPNINDL